MDHAKEGAVEDPNRLLVQFYNSIEEILSSSTDDYTIMYKTVKGEGHGTSEKRARSSEETFLPNGDIFCATEYCMAFICDYPHICGQRNDALKFASSFAAQILWPNADPSLEPESCSASWEELVHFDYNTVCGRSFFDPSLARKKVSPSVREFGMSLASSVDDLSLFTTPPACPKKDLHIVPGDIVNHTDAVIDSDINSSCEGDSECSLRVVRLRLLIVGALLRHCIRGLFIDACRRTTYAQRKDRNTSQLQLTDSVDEFNEMVRKEACMSLISYGAVTSPLVRLVTSVLRGSVSFPMSNDLIDFVEPLKSLPFDTLTSNAVDVPTKDSDVDDDLKCLFEEVILHILSDFVFIGKGALSSADLPVEDLMTKVSIARQVLVVMSEVMSYLQFTRVYSSEKFEEWAVNCATSGCNEVVTLSDPITCLRVLRKDADAELFELSRMKEKRIKAEVDSLILRQFPNGDLCDEVINDIMQHVTERFEKSSLYKPNSERFEVLSGQNLLSINLGTTTCWTAPKFESENSIRMSHLSWQDIMEERLSYILGDFICALGVFHGESKDGSTDTIQLFIKEFLYFQHIDLVGKKEAQEANTTQSESVEIIKTDNCVAPPYIDQSIGSDKKSIVFDASWLDHQIVWGKRYDDILFDRDQYSAYSQGVELEKLPKCEERRKRLEAFSIFSDDEEEEWRVEGNTTPFQFVKRILMSEADINSVSHEAIEAEDESEGEDEDDVYTSKVSINDCYTLEDNAEQDQQTAVFSLTFPKYVIASLASENRPYSSNDEEVSLMYLCITGTTEEKKERVFSMKRRELAALGSKYGPSVLRLFLLLSIKHPGPPIINECNDLARHSKIYRAMCQNLWRLPTINNIQDCLLFKYSETIKTEPYGIDSLQVKHPIMNHFLRSHNLRKNFDNNLSFFGTKERSVADRIESFGLPTAAFGTKIGSEFSLAAKQKRVKQYNHPADINNSALPCSKSDHLLTLEVRRLINENSVLLNPCKGSSTDHLGTENTSGNTFSKDEAQSLLRLEIMKGLNVSSFFIVASSMRKYLRGTNPHTSLRLFYQLLPHLTSCLRIEAIEGACDGRHPPMSTALFTSNLWMAMNALTLAYALVKQIVTPTRQRHEGHTCTSKAVTESSGDSIHSRFSLRYTIDFPSERVANDEKQKAAKLLLVARMGQAHRDNTTGSTGMFNKSFDDQAATLNPIECYYLYLTIVAESKGKETLSVTDTMNKGGDHCSIPEEDIISLFSGSSTSSLFKIRVLKRWKDFKEETSTQYMKAKGHAGSRYTVEDEAAAMDLYDQDCEDAIETMIYTSKSQPVSSINRRVKSTTHTIRKSKLFLMFCHFFQALMTIATRCRSPEHRRFALKVFSSTLSLFTLPVRRKLIIGLFALAPHGEISSIALSEIKKELEIDIRTYLNPICTWYKNHGHSFVKKNSFAVLLPPPDLLVGSNLFYCDHQLIKSIIDAVANWIKSEIRLGIHEHVSVVVGALGLLLTIISSDLRVVKEVLFSDWVVSQGRPGVLSALDHSLLPLMIWRIHDTCLFTSYLERESINHINEDRQCTVCVVVRKSLLLRNSYDTHDDKMGNRNEMTSEFITHEDTIKNKSAEHLMTSLVHNVIEPLELWLLKEIDESSTSSGGGPVVSYLSSQLDPLDKYSLEQVISLLKGKYVIV